MKTIDTDDLPDIPTRVAVCPICGASIEIVEINEWETETGRATDGGLHINCTTEPDFDGDVDVWEEWQARHWSTPYIDWMLVEDRVLTWFNAHYRVRTEEQ